MQPHPALGFWVSPSRGDLVGCRLGGEYSAGDRSAVSGALGTRATPTGVAADVSREIHLGKKQRFFRRWWPTWRRENRWFGRERKKETLDEFFQKQLSAFQRSAIRAACVDM